MKKILLMSHKFFPTKGGTQTLVLNFGRHLVKRGFEVTVYTSATANRANEEWLEGIHVVRFSRQNAIPRPWYVTLGMMAKPIWAEYDLLHSFSIITFQCLYAATASKLSRVPLVINPEYHPWWGFYERTIGTWEMNTADRLVAQCAQERSALLRFKSSERVVEIPPGIDRQTYSHLPDPKEFRQKHGIEEDSEVVLYVGSLSYQKGVPRLIAAMPRVVAQHPKARLVLVGRGGISGVGQEQTRSFGTTIRIIDDASDEELIQAYALADLFVFPSVSESFGIALLEAAAAGLPIVSTPVGVAEELVIDGVTGFKVNPSSQDLAARIVEALNSEELKENARNQRNKVLAAYDWEKVTDSLANLYNGLITPRN